MAVEQHKPVAMESPVKLQPQRTLWGDALRRFARNQRAVLGLLVLSLLGLIGLLAPVLAPYSPMTMDLGGEFVAPSAEHLFGTDELGRDVLSRMIHAARNDLGFSLITVLIAATTGLTIG